MERETLADHLRRATRNFTSALGEDQVLDLGRGLARELARAHAESPARHPDMDPAAITLSGSGPELEGGGAEGDAAEDLFQLGALLSALATGTEPHVSWRLDGPPETALSTVRRRGVLQALATPRRADRFPTAAAAAAAFDAVIAAPSSTGAPWPLFRGDPARTGARGGPSPASLRRLWDARVGPVVASPVVTPDAVLIATADGRLLWLDRETGRLLYETGVGAAVESSPAVADDERTLYVGTDDGGLVAVDVVTGRERHRSKLGGMVRSSPLPLRGQVIVGLVEGKTGGVVAIDTAQGKVLWVRKTGAVFSSPALAGGRILIGSDDGHVHTLDPAKGTNVWSAALGGKVRSTPAVAGTVAIAADFAGSVVALSLADGAPVWTAPLGHPVYSSPCVQEGLAVVGCNDGHLHGVDLGSGATRFEVKTGGPVVASPVARGGVFLCGSTDGTVSLVAGDGTVRARLDVAAGGIQSSPALDGERAFIGSARGVHALQLAP